ncbi:MAG: hypothetical protein E7329_05560 [Clostridiales bacterium]|nr:hypothetical protein [Clostridiales bacterium]
MQTMNFAVKAGQTVRTWPRVELYQNSTLRYTPPADFADFWVSNNCRPKIIRTWVTLDEIWDIETDTYDWNYQIGVDKLGDKRYYPYDWPISRPSETHFEDYLTSFCRLADEAMLNIRRFERETADGLMSYEKYEEVVEKVIEHCKDLCDNIVYIEVSNESEIPSFGSLTVAEYMPLYNCICHVVKRLNERRGWNLKVGGTAMTGGWTLRGLWHDYMKALAEDTDPDKRIDFYSFHAYNPDNNCLQQMYNMHKSDVVKYGLPDAPLFFDEYGTRRATGVLTDSLQNASETLTGMLRGADLHGMYIFPWCTFHNPELQMSYTQYLRLPEGGYAPTPNGHAVHMLCGMLDDEVVIQGNTNFRARATRKGNQVYMIVTNPSEDPLQIACTVEQLEGQKAEVVMRQVDAKQNNVVTNPPCTELAVTEFREVTLVEGAASIACELPPFAFACWTITAK